MEEERFSVQSVGSKQRFQDRGVEAFPDNRYVEEMIRREKLMQVGDRCRKHKQHLVLFCNETGCQEQICPACVFVKHKDHKIIDLTSKAEEVRAKMEDKKGKARDISLILADYMTEINTLEEKINRDTSQNLDKVDVAREQLHERIQELHKKIQQETEAHKAELIQTQKKNLAQLKNTKDKIQQCKAQLDSFYVEVEKSINCLSDNAVVQNDGNVEQVFKDLCLKELRVKTFSIELQEYKYEPPELPAELQMLVTGRIDKVDLDTNLQAPLKRITNITRIPLKAEDVDHINCRLVHSENTSFRYFDAMCMLEDGSIIMSGKKPSDDNCTLKRIGGGDSNWELNIGRNELAVNGLCRVNMNKEYLVASTENREYLIASTLNRKLEVRDVSNGKLLHECNVEFSTRAVCSIGDGIILVVNSSVDPCTLVEFKLIEKEGGIKVENMKKVIKTEINTSAYTSTFGLTSYRYDGMTSVVVAGCGAETIQAMNYQLLQTLWKIINETVDGKTIRPADVCHDEMGHIFITDFKNNRVVGVSPGQIKRSLLDLPGPTLRVAFDFAQRKLIVIWGKENERILNTYSVEYVVV